MSSISQADQDGIVPNGGVPPKKPERVSAIVVALLAIGFSTWVLAPAPAFVPRWR